MNSSTIMLIKDMNMAMVAVLVFLLIGFFILDKMVGTQKFAEEPPYIPTALPYFGHSIGLVRHRMLYYVGLA